MGGRGGAGVVGATVTGALAGGPVSGPAWSLSRDPQPTNATLPTSSAVAMERTGRMELIPLGSGLGGALCDNHRRN